MGIYLYKLLAVLEDDIFSETGSEYSDDEDMVGGVVAIGINEKGSTETDRQSILVVDDYESARMACALNAMSLGYEVITVNAGQDAVDYMASNEGIKIGLIFMDFDMPGLTGAEATKLILEVNSEVVVVAHTANDNQERVAACKAAGMKGRLPKPFNIKQMSEVLSDLHPCPIIDS
jgi:CheY-like chemotaxis protein